ncbi:PQ-loop-domain-containing protein, partial [Scleroderma citrinum]
LGWISIACWDIVYSLQVIENFQLQSREGLSVLFVYIWLLGDLCNVVGALITHLLPTVIILGVYYTICDFTLLCQVYYYRRKPRMGRIRPTPFLNGTPMEQTCLLEEGVIIQEQQAPAVLRVFLQCTAAVVFVVFTGVVAYFISERFDSRGPLFTGSLDTSLDLEIQVIGWTSAICYVAVRVPQIFKKFKTRCEGLAPGLFFFAILGNSTYALSICVTSLDRDYLIRNASWLAGTRIPSNSI